MDEVTDTLAMLHAAHGDAVGSALDEITTALRDAADRIRHARAEQLAQVGTRAPDGTLLAATDLVATVLGDYARAIAPLPAAQATLVRAAGRYDRALAGHAAPAQGSGGT